jgi:hypothetical protein
MDVPNGKYFAVTYEKGVALFTDEKRRDEKLAALEASGDAVAMPFDAEVKDGKLYLFMEKGWQHVGEFKNGKFVPSESFLDAGEEDLGFPGRLSDGETFEF